MSSTLTALVNGLLVSALITSAVWLATSVSCRAWNAATRYAIWWATLLVTVAMPLLYLGTTTQHPKAPPQTKEDIEIPRPGVLGQQDASRGFASALPSSTEQTSLPALAAPSHPPVFPFNSLPEAGQSGSSSRGC